MAKDRTGVWGVSIWRTCAKSQSKGYPQGQSRLESPQKEASRLAYQGRSGFSSCEFFPGRLSGSMSPVAIGQWSLSLLLCSSFHHHCSSQYGSWHSLEWAKWEEARKGEQHGSQSVPVTESWKWHPINFCRVFSVRNESLGLAHAHTRREWIIYTDSMAGAFLKAAYRHVSLGFRISEDRQLDPSTVFSWKGALGIFNMLISWV